MRPLRRHSILNCMQYANTVSKSCDSFANWRFDVWPNVVVMLLRCTGSSEASYSWPQFSRTGAFPVHATQSHHGSESRSPATWQPRIKSCCSSFDRQRCRIIKELSHVQRNGTVADYGHCLDCQQVCIIYIKLLIWLLRMCWFYSFSMHSKYVSFYSWGEKRKLSISLNWVGWICSDSLTKRCYLVACLE